MVTRANSVVTEGGNMKGQAMYIERRETETARQNRTVLIPNIARTEGEGS